MGLTPLLLSCWFVCFVVHGREMFGATEAHLQSVQQKLAQIRTDIQVHTTFVDNCIEALAREELDTETASMAKVATSDLANRVADVCLQFFGGYGQKERITQRVCVQGYYSCFSSISGFVFLFCVRVGFLKNNPLAKLYADLRVCRICLQKA
jgi:alkylation response protein AidB-like acyl-CoA dehydrogenase